MIDLLKKYVENRFQLVKLESVAVMSNLAVSLISSILFLALVLLILLMLSFSLSYWLASVFESNAIGFAAVGGIYILALIIYRLFVKDAVDTKVKDQIVKAVFSAQDELTDKEM
ncbi:MAG: phage holin family protein [Flavobacteriaceae bacterium]|nr:phage holin family protein [Flavobacteriaceae bacterium]